MAFIQIYTDETKVIPLINQLSKYGEINVLPRNSFKNSGLILENNNLIYKTTEHEIKLNWLKQIKYHESQSYTVKKQLLAKALGIKGPNYKVIDLTCGTGKDSLLLLSFRATVICFERNPSVFALLLNEFMNLEESLSKNLQLNFGILTKEFIEQLEEKPNALYFDPMFTDQNRKKTALKRKEMLLFDDLVGADLDAGEVLSEILTFGVKRVVVKRHPKSLDLLPGVTARFKGKSARYDLYCV